MAEGEVADVGAELEFPEHFGKMLHDLRRRSFDARLVFEESFNFVNPSRKIEHGLVEIKLQLVGNVFSEWRLRATTTLGCGP